MFPINNLRGIEVQESELKEKHVVVFLLVKPSDENSQSIIEHFNYYHHRAGKYCSIYPVGYSRSMFGFYPDVQKIRGVDHEEWEYSDRCFIDFCDELKERLAGWRYSGEPELIILQNRLTDSEESFLDFTNCNYIDINYGLEHGYIDSFQRFMERLLVACRSEVESHEVLGRANVMRLKPRNVLISAIETAPKLPKPIKKILGDRLFYKSSRGTAARGL